MSPTDKTVSAKPAQPTLLDSLEGLVRDSPNDTWVTVPKSPDLKQGWRNITYLELSHAINGLIQWMKKNVGFGGENETVAYMGLNDIRYYVTTLAVMKMGHKILLPSPRNAVEGQTNLFNLTKCKVLLYSESFENELIQNPISGTHAHQIPLFDDLVQHGEGATPIESFYRSNEDKFSIILHTSGSTGLPKPIYLTNGWIAALADCRDMPTPAGRSNTYNILVYHGKPIFSMMPFFHIVAFALFARTFFDPGPMVLPPAGRPINPILIMEILDQTKPPVGVFVPSVLEDLSGSSEGLAAISNLEMVAWSGGPIAYDAGERIRQKTSIVPLIGSTETGLLQTMVPEDSADWHSYEWSQESGIVMESDSDGLYECVVKRKPDRRFQGVFYNFPDLEEYRTKDLYAKHATKSDLWEYRGRKDDVLVLSNGEKVQPVTFEMTLEDHPLLHGAIVVGQGRFQTGVIIEPNWEKFGSDSNPEDLIDQVWPTIETANRDLPAHGRVWKSKVVVAKADKPFSRAPKGSIMRRASVQAYEREIDAMYSNESFDEQLGKLNNDADEATVKAFVRQAVLLISPGFPKEGSDDVDFFSTGVDSLQVMGISTALSHAISKDDRTSIAPRDVYANPNIGALSGHVLRIFGNADAENAPSREESIANMLEKYTRDLPERALPKPTTTLDSDVVVLTGSTGALGNYILEGLITSEEASKVYCLNRTSDAENRQRQSFESRQTPAVFDKVTFLQTDFSIDHFGLSDDVYTTLLETATHFIHNAWAVDFNKTLPSYEDTHVAGVRRVVDFSLASTHDAQISFVSSIATVQAWPTLYPDRSTIPEQTFSDIRTTIPTGYSESKYIAEHILETAATRSGVPATVIRSGQLAGPSTKSGLWNPHEWVPSIVSTSKAMGLVPTLLGTQDTIDWVPLDTAAKTILDLVAARTSDPSPFEVFHLVNPRTGTWSSLVPVLLSRFGSSCRPVDFREWVDALAQVPTTREEVEKKPGVKLLDFYRGLAAGGEGMVFETAKTEARSTSLRALGPVDGALMERWLDQWGL